MSHPERTIEITVAADGKATVQARGFAGNSCRDATKYLERALGEATAEQLTQEFYLSQPAREQSKTRN